MNSCYSFLPGVYGSLKWACSHRVGFGTSSTLPILELPTHLPERQFCLGVRQRDPCECRVGGFLVSACRCWMEATFPKASSVVLASLGEPGSTHTWEAGLGFWVGSSILTLMFRVCCPHCPSPSQVQSFSGCKTSKGICCQISICQTAQTRGFLVGRGGSSLVGKSWNFMAQPRATPLPGVCGWDSILGEQQVAALPSQGPQDFATQQFLLIYSFAFHSVSYLHKMLNRKI